MRALVLGATGHIGGHVVRALLAEGVGVRAFHRAGSELGTLAGLGVETATGDLHDAESLEAALLGCDWLFHTAAAYPKPGSSREEALAEGRASVTDVLKVARRAGVRRILFTSSAATIGPPSNPNGLAHERDRLSVEGPLPLYTAVKLAEEQEALRFAREGLPVVIVNPSVCIDAHDPHCFSTRLVAAFARPTLLVYIETRFNVIATSEVGRLQVLAARQGRVGERYILGAFNTATSAFSRLVAEVAGVSPRRWRVPYRAAWLAAHLSELEGRLRRRPPRVPLVAIELSRAGKHLDCRKSVEELGYLPQVRLEEAVRRALEDLRARGIVP